MHSRNNKTIFEFYTTWRYVYAFSNLATKMMNIALNSICNILLCIFSILLCMFSILWSIFKSSISWCMFNILKWTFYILTFIRKTCDVYSMSYDVCPISCDVLVYENLVMCILYFYVYLEIFWCIFHLVIFIAL